MDFNNNEITGINNNFDLDPKKLIDALLFGVEKIQMNSVRKRSKIKNLKVVPASRNSIEFTSVSGYSHSYSTLAGVQFEGAFGANPQVFIIFSRTDDIISIRDRESLNRDELEVIKLSKFSFGNHKYEYKLEKNYLYNSNFNPVIKPYILVITGEDNIGFAVLITLDQPMASGSSNTYSITQMLTLEGINEQTYYLAFPWPNKNHLLSTITYKSRRYCLSDSEIESILSLKKEFIKNMGKKVENALKDF